MMKNYISINISYLVHKSRLGQDEFGNIFELNKGLIGKYINNISLPKIETIQKICSHFEITIDDFINKDLSVKPVGIYKNEILYASEPEPEPYVISPRYVEMLEKAIIDKDKLISVLEEALKDKEKIINTIENKKTDKSA
jgi:transcriptional regulator with XRE-family HTH domain